MGSGPDAIAITPNGSTAYVGNYNDDTVTPINLVTDTAGTPIPVGGAPTSIAITPDGSTAYVGRAFDSGIQLDLTTNSMQPGASPSGFASAITPDGATVVGTNPQDNNVDVVNPATDTGTTVAALNDPEGVAITPDGSTAYVAYSPFTTNKGALLPIPLADTNAPGTPINLGTNSAYAVAITPDGSTAFVTDLTGGNLVPVDLASGTAGTPIPLGSEGTNPIAIAITPDQAPDRPHARHHSRKPDRQLRRIGIDRGRRDHRLVRVELRRRHHRDHDDPDRHPHLHEHRSDIRWRRSPRPDSTGTSTDRAGVHRPDGEQRTEAHRPRPASRSISIRRMRQSNIRRCPR